MTSTRSAAHLRGHRAPDGQSWAKVRLRTFRPFVDERACLRALWKLPGWTRTNNPGRLRCSLPRAGSRRRPGGAAEGEGGADGEHPGDEDEEADEPDREWQQRRHRKARPAEPAGEHTEAQCRERDGDDEEDRSERPAYEEQEADVLDDPARVGVEFEIVGHRRK